MKCSHGKRKSVPLIHTMDMVNRIGRLRSVSQSNNNSTLNPSAPFFYSLAFNVNVMCHVWYNCQPWSVPVVLHKLHLLALHPGDRAALCPSDPSGKHHTLTCKLQVCWNKDPVCVFLYETFGGSSCTCAWFIPTPSYFPSHTLIVIFSGPSFLPDPLFTPVC